MMEKEQAELLLEISKSKGRSRNFNKVAWIKPLASCDNKPHRISYFDEAEYDEKVKKICEKYYLPSLAFKIKGKTFASNSEKNAIKEYWRICEKEEIGIIPEVEAVNPRYVYAYSIRKTEAP